MNEHQKSNHKKRKKNWFNMHATFVSNIREIVNLFAQERGTLDDDKCESERKRERKRVK